MKHTFTVLGTSQISEKLFYGKIIAGIILFSEKG